MRVILAALFLAATLTAAPAPTEGVEMACASHSEWDQVDEGLTVPNVRDIIGGPGSDGPTKPGQYSIWWPLCWRSDKVGIVWFSNVSNLVVDKNVVLEP